MLYDDPSDIPGYPFREDEWDDENPAFEPEFNERGRFDMVGYAYAVCGFSRPDPRDDVDEERLIEERRGR